MRMTSRGRGCRKVLSAGVVPARCVGFPVLVVSCLRAVRLPSRASPSGERYMHGIVSWVVTVFLLAGLVGRHEQAAPHSQPTQPHTKVRLPPSKPIVFVEE